MTYMDPIERIEKKLDEILHCQRDYHGRLVRLETLMVFPGALIVLISLILSIYAQFKPAPSTLERCPGRAPTAGTSETYISSVLER